MNFGDFDLYGLQNFGKVFVTSVRPCWDKWWKILILPIWWYRQVMINHRGGILIFCQILNFGRNRKFEILNPSSNPNSGSLTLKPKFGFELGLRISNFRFLPKFKIWQKIKIPPRWFIITWRYHQIGKIRIFHHLSQHGRTDVTKTFPKFWSPYRSKSPKFIKIGSHRQNFEENS